jgi:hypothetical protein
MTIDERLQALTMNLELAGHDIVELRKLVEIDAENIRALARVAEIHDRRLTNLEGDAG